MLQRLPDTESLSGGQWGLVLGLSIITPALAWIDKAVALLRQRNPSISLAAGAAAYPGDG